MKLLTLAVLLLISTLGHAAPAVKQILLAHASSQEDLDDTAAVAAEEFRRLVHEQSAGRLKVEIVPNGVLGGNREMATLTQKGVIHSSIVTLGGATPLYPPLNVFFLPYAFTHLDQARKTFDGPFTQKLASGIETSQLKLLGLVDAPGFHILTNSKKPIRSVEEMAGLKIRTIPGAAPLDAMLKAVGAKPVKVSSREEIFALASGTIDGQSNPPSVILARGIDGAQRYATLTNHVFLPHVWLFHQATFNELSPDDAKLVQSAAQQAIQHTHRFAKALEKSEQGQPGLMRRMKVSTLSASETQKFKNLITPPTEQAIIKQIGEQGREWLDHYKTYLH